MGHPCGKPRAGAFSPDTAWEWVRNEIDTISTRSQDPYFISEEDKKIMPGRGTNKYVVTALIHLNMGMMITMPI
ncbi:MAG: pyruvate formate lyase family protein [Clostridium sp.]|uniref:pyruvate formate lyase family protein n=1 Tax=Clostridium sp. TaxID=1506 RepID=UPI003D6D42A5